MQRSLRLTVCVLAVTLICWGAAGCDGEEQDAGASKTRTVKVDGDGLRYLYVGADGQFQPVTSLEEVPLAARGATAVWNSRAKWKRPEGDEEYVVDLVGAEPGDEVTAKRRSRAWMRQASDAGRSAARLGLSIKKTAEPVARWAGHKPWLWQVGTAEPPTYILGTTPSASIGGLEELDPAVRRAYRQSQKVLLPLDPTDVEQQHLIRYGQREQPVDFRNELSEEAYKTLLDRLGGRIGPARMAYLKPWLLLMEFAMDIRPGDQDPASGRAEALNRLNSRILRQIQVSAKADEKELEYLYTPPDMYSLYVEMVDYEDVERVAENLDEVRVQYNMFQEAYRTRHVEGLREHLVNPTFAWPHNWGVEGVVMRDAESEAIDSLLRAVEQGNTFVVAGVEDMYGSKGVKSLLEKKDIRIELVD